MKLLLAILMAIASIACSNTTEPAPVSPFNGVWQVTITGGGNNGDFNAICDVTLSAYGKVLSWQGMEDEPMRYDGNFTNNTFSGFRATSMSFVNIYISIENGVLTGTYSEDFFNYKIERRLKGFRK